jgi:2-iminobutanoate/2-iminopropanoate deaminase
MENLTLVLAGLDFGFEHVVMARIYLTRFKQDYAAMNETYQRYFPPDRLPARTCVARPPRVAKNHGTLPGPCLSTRA